MNQLTNFHYSFFGSKTLPKLVLVHGLMSSHDTWAKVLPELQKYFYIFCYDQRGHGKSFKPQTGYSTKDYSNDLKFLVDQIEWDQFFLLGHSMGARNSIYFTSQNSHRVKKLIVEDIGVESRPDSVTKTEKLLSIIPTPFQDFNTGKEFYFSSFLKLYDGPHPPHLVAEYLMSKMEIKSNGNYDWIFSRDAMIESVKVGRSHDLWKEWEKIPSPLLLRGENSDELSQDIYEQMLKRNSTANGFLFPKAGHSIHKDSTALFVRVLLDFLITPH